MSEIVTVSARAARAAELAAAVLQARGTEHLDALVTRAARELDVQSCHLSVLTDRQVTASACGPVISASDRGAETRFDDTVCANVLRGDGPLVIPDAHADARVSSIPAVLDGTLGAYLGAPLRSGGLVVGVLCVFARDPRPWSSADVAVIESIAVEVVAELDRLAGISPAEGT